MSLLKIITQKTSFRKNQFQRYCDDWKVYSKLYKEAGGKVSIFEALKYFQKWKISLRPGSGPLADCNPWIVFPAIEFINKIIQPSMKVFEFGSGGSSAFFSSKAQSIHSIEHDKKWLEYTSDIINLDNKNSWIGSWVPPKKREVLINSSIVNNENYISSWPEFKNYEFKDYASSIDSYPNNFFDIVFIDGRVRVDCFRHSKEKIKPGGYLGLDNSERERYKSIHETLKNEGWEVFNFFSVGPYVNYEFWQTTFWKKPR